MRTAVPAGRVTVATRPGWKPRDRAASLGSSVAARSDTVSGAPCRHRLDADRVELVGEGRSRRPRAVRDQPSGTFTVKPRAGGRVGDEGLVVGDVAGGADLGVRVVGVAGAGLLAADAQPATAARRARTASAAARAVRMRIEPPADGSRSCAGDRRRCQVSARSAAGQRQVKVAAIGPADGGRYAAAMSGDGILLVEDDDAIASGLVRVLESQGYAVRRIGARAAAADAPAARTSRSCILDLGLPDIDGIDVCRRLRARARTWRSSSSPHATRSSTSSPASTPAPTTTSSSRSGSRSCSRASVRTSAHGRHRPRPPERAHALRRRRCVVDLAARRGVWHGERSSALRPKEFDLLALLVAEAGRVVTRERIMREVWDTDWLGSTKTLDTHMLALRGKLGAEPITTLRGVGYRFERPDEAPARARDRRRSRRSRSSASPSRWRLVLDAHLPRRGAAAPAARHGRRHPRRSTSAPPAGTRSSCRASARPRWRSMTVAGRRVAGRGPARGDAVVRDDAAARTPGGPRSAAASSSSRSRWSCDERVAGAVRAEPLATRRPARRARARAWLGLARGARRDGLPCGRAAALSSARRLVAPARAPRGRGAAPGRRRLLRPRAAQRACRSSTPSPTRSTPPPTRLDELVSARARVQRRRLASAAHAAGRPCGSSSRRWSCGGDARRSSPPRSAQVDRLQETIDDAARRRARRAAPRRPLSTSRRCWTRRAARWRGPLAAEGRPLRDRSDEPARACWRLAAGDRRGPRRAARQRAPPRRRRP